MGDEGHDGEHSSGAESERLSERTDTGVIKTKESILTVFKFKWKHKEED